MTKLRSAAEVAKDCCESPGYRAIAIIEARDREIVEACRAALRGEPAWVHTSGPLTKMEMILRSSALAALDAVLTEEDASHD